jgi:hypothetical protein
MHTCIYTYIYIYLNIHIYIYILTNIYTYIHKFKHTYKHTYISIYTYPGLSGSDLASLHAGLGIWDTTTDTKLSIQFVPTGTLIYSFLCIYICIFMYTYVSMYVFKYVCIFIYLYPYVYPYVYTYLKNIKLSIQFIPAGTLTDIKLSIHYLYICKYMYIYHI